MKAHAFINNHIIINEAILVYLGANQQGGYQPIGNHEQRLKDFYPQNWESISSDVKKITSIMWTDIKIDWNICPSLSEATDHMESQLALLFPWLSPEARRALANYFAFCEK